MWPVYYSKTDAIVLVVDVWDSDRADALATIARQILVQTEAVQRSHIPILIVGNTRNDAEVAGDDDDDDGVSDYAASSTASHARGDNAADKLSRDDVQRICDVRSLSLTHPVDLLAIDALSGAGCSQLLDWLSARLE